MGYGDKQSVARPLYHLHETVFVLARHQVVDVASGTYNSILVRMVAIVSICLLQAYQMWNFITFHLRRRREAAVLASSGLGGGASAAATKNRKTQQEKTKARKEKAAREAAAKEDSDLPE